MEYKLMYTKRAEKDARLLERSEYNEKAKELLLIIARNPYQKYPPYEKLWGELEDYYSRRINRHHRIVYDVLPNVANLKDENGVPYKGIVKIMRMWTHYEKI